MLTWQLSKHDRARNIHVCMNIDRKLFHEKSPKRHLPPATYNAFSWNCLFVCALLSDLLPFGGLFFIFYYFFFTGNLIIIPSLKYQIMPSEGWTSCTLCKYSRLTLSIWETCLRSLRLPFNNLRGCPSANRSWIRQKYRGFRFPPAKRVHWSHKISSQNWLPK